MGCSERNRRRSRWVSVVFTSSLILLSSSFFFFFFYFFSRIVFTFFSLIVFTFFSLIVYLRTQHSSPTNQPTQSLFRCFALFLSFSSLFHSIPLHFHFILCSLSSLVLDHFFVLYTPASLPAGASAVSSVSCRLVRICFQIQFQIFVIHAMDYFNALN